MEDTVRALVVLGAVALLLAPLTNAILDDAARTADRAFLRNAEYDGEPPFVPDDVEPPEGFEPPPADLDGDGVPDDAEFPLPSCEPVTRVAAEWHHAEPADSIGSRAGASSEAFEVGDRDLGIRWDFRVTGLYGGISARLVPEDGEPITVYEVDQRLGYSPPPSQGSVRADDARFLVGPWSAVLDLGSTVSYQTLDYVVAVASCPEARA